MHKFFLKGWDTPLAQGKPQGCEVFATNKKNKITFSGARSCEAYLFFLYRSSWSKYSMEA